MHQQHKLIDTLDFHRILFEISLNKENDESFLQDLIDELQILIEKI
jgi:hypothetical protein